MDDFVQTALRCIADHGAWAGPILFLVSFGESLAVISFMIPGTAILFAAGTMIPETLSLGPTLVGAVAGAALGDGVSYWLGRRFSGGIARIWPFTRYPAAIPQGIAFFKRHGGKSIFIGRFFGPARATVPLAAGLLRMPPGRFWLMNLASAVLWAPTILFLGAAFGRAATLLLGIEDAFVLVLLGFGALGLGGVWLIGRGRR